MEAGQGIRQGTHRGNVIYLHVLAWDGNSVKLPPLPGRIVKAEVLTGGTVGWSQDAGGLVLLVPVADHREIDTIVQMTTFFPSSITNNRSL